MRHTRTGQTHPYLEALGPFYDDAGARHQLGQIGQRVLQVRRRSWTVLAMQTQDRTWLYPAWQFDGRGGIRAELAPVLIALRGLDRWAAGLWLVNQHPDLGGISPREALREGVESTAVAAIAAHDKAGLLK